MGKAKPAFDPSRVDACGLDYQIIHPGVTYASIEVHEIELQQPGER